MDLKHDRVLRLFRANDPDHYVSMLIYARGYDLPFVKEGLVDTMEFWGNSQTHVISIVLIGTNGKEIHRENIDYGGTELYDGIAEMLAK